MGLPAVDRAAELRASGARPLVCYAIGTGLLRLDVELAAVKHLTGLGAVVEARDPAGFTVLREAGNRLGWTSSWVETVLGECQPLYENRVLDTAPRRRAWARGLEQRFADVAMAGPIRDILLRYVWVRAAVLRPNSVESLINDLLPFAEYLTAHHPQLTSLHQPDRACIEGYLAWNRTRGWRGQRAASSAVAARA